MKETYLGNKKFKRRGLYVHEVNSRLLDIEAAKQQTDPSQILNAALAIYFSRRKEN